MCSTLLWVASTSCFSSASGSAVVFMRSVSSTSKRTINSCSAEHLVGKPEKRERRANAGTRHLFYFAQNLQPLLSGIFLLLLLCQRRKKKTFGCEEKVKSAEQSVASSYCQPSPPEDPELGLRALHRWPGEGNNKWTRRLDPKSLQCAPLRNKPDNYFFFLVWIFSFCL